MRLCRVPWILIIGSSVATGCGGLRTGPADGVLEPDGAGLAPPPSCVTICRHIIDACTPGADLDACVADCERTNRDFASCPRPLRDYLECVVQTRVECQPDKVVILDCSAERQVLEHCVP